MSRLPLHALTTVLLFAACAETPEPAPEPVVTPTPPSSFNRSFDAALGAAADVGVEVKSADRAGGRITGTKGGVEVTINVLRQADGTLKVAFNAPGSPETNPKLGDRWISAYQRRMGR